MRLSTCIAGLSGFLIIVSAANATISIRWASTATPGPMAPLNLSSALGQPDNATSDFNGADASAKFSDFDSSVTYSRAALESLLDVPSSVFDAADFVAFDANGTQLLPFENTTWTFRSGGQTEIFVVPGNLPGGNIRKFDYAPFFGFPVPPGNRDFAFVLFNFSVVEPFASDFEVTVQSDGLVEGDTPNIDAMGVLPEPASAGFLLVGMFLLTRRRRAN
jgi:hypothetical protein